MKKLLAVLLSLCLVVGMLPVMAFADGGIELIGPVEKGDDESSTGVSIVVKGTEDEEDEETEEDYIVNDDDAYNTTTKLTFNFLQDALNDAKSGETVILRKDAQITVDEVGTEAVVVKEGVTLVIATGVTLKIDAGVTFENYGKIIEKGKIEGIVTDKTEPEPEPEPEPEVPEVQQYWPVTIYAPGYATVTVKDANGYECAPFKDNVWSLLDGNYTYTVSYRGYVLYNGSFTVNGAALVINREWVEPAWSVIVKPAANGDVWVSDRDAAYGDYVRIYVDPDTGYYLSDLTVTTVNGADIDVWHWKDNIYVFRMPSSRVVVDADFASAPSEYRVYVDSSILHGDVSVDTVYAEEGEWVYITVDPDVGYRLYNLTVTRPSGNTVKVEHVRDNVYRFSMPGVRVTVDAEFIRTVTPFTDVRLADWFYEYVSFAYRYGLMEGINSYQFAPDATATRAMVVQILYRMSGEPAVSYGSGFTDVASNAWYADAIAWAARNNIVNGTSAATFDPNAPVTREQFATMLYRYARYRGFNTSLTANILSYYDVNQVSEYAFEALQWACAEGIVNGTSTGYLTPQGNATRAQLAAMLMRFCTEYFDL